MRIIIGALLFSVLAMAPITARAGAGDPHLPFIFHIESKHNSAAREIPMNEIIWRSFLPVSLHSLIPVRASFTPELIASSDEL